MDPDNRDSYVCARCKNNVARRIKHSKIICERTGCFEIDLHYDGFSVEQIMITIQCILEEHKKEALIEGSKCQGKEEFTEINVRIMTDDEQFIEI